MIGSAGKVFSEIREITGTNNTTTTHNYVVISVDYPGRYTKENTRVLPLEVNLIMKVGLVPEPQMVVKLYDNAFFFPSHIDQQDARISCISVRKNKRPVMGL